MKNTSSKKTESYSLIQIAGFMAVAARTAPKAKGTDNIETLVISDKKLKSKLIDFMNKTAKTHNKPGFKRDAENCKDSPAILLIGTKTEPIGLTHCSFCGYKDCSALLKAKATCAYNTIDLGIAVGSAVSVASDFRIDNRIMYSIGKAALEINLFKNKKVKIALGIPLSCSGKSPFFDRK